MQKYRPLDSEDLPTNTSGNEHFQVVVERAYSRRGFLKSGIGLSAAVFLAGPFAAYAKSNDTNKQPSSLLGFDAIPISTDDTIKIAAGYTATAFAPWGTPLFTDAPAWKTDGSDNAAAQARQVGDNHDGIHFFPINGSNTEGLHGRRRVDRAGQDSKRRAGCRWQLCQPRWTAPNGSACIRPAAKSTSP